MSEQHKVYHDSACASERPMVSTESSQTNPCDCGVDDAIEYVADLERRLTEQTTHMHRMLALVGQALDGRHVSRDFGGSAPEDVQGLLDQAFDVHRRLTEAEECPRALLEGFADRAEQAERGEEALLARAHQAERERDEAEERIEIAYCTQAAIERERDEARAEVERLRKSDKALSACEDTLADVAAQRDRALALLKEARHAGGTTNPERDKCVDWERRRAALLEETNNQTKEKE